MVRKGLLVSNTLLSNAGAAHPRSDGCSGNPRVLWTIGHGSSAPILSDGSAQRDVETARSFLSWRKAVTPCLACHLRLESSEIVSQADPAALWGNGVESDE